MFVGVHSRNNIDFSRVKAPSSLCTKWGSILVGDYNTPGVHNDVKSRRNSGTTVGNFNLVWSLHAPSFPFSSHVYRDFTKDDY